MPSTRSIVVSTVLQFDCMGSSCENLGSHELACKLSEFLGGPFSRVGAVHASLLVIGVVGALIVLSAQYALRFRFAFPVRKGKSEPQCIVCLFVGLFGSGLCIVLVAYGINVLVGTNSEVIPDGAWTPPADAPPVDPMQSTIIYDSGGNATIRNLFVALFILHGAHCVLGM